MPVDIDIKPCSNISSSCLLTSALSPIGILYGLLLTGPAPGSVSMTCCTILVLPNSEIDSATTSEYSFSLSWSLLNSSSVQLVVSLTRLSPGFFLVLGFLPMSVRNNSDSLSTDSILPTTVFFWIVSLVVDVFITGMRTEPSLVLSTERPTNTDFGQKVLSPSNTQSWSFLFVQLTLQTTATSAKGGMSTDCSSLTSPPTALFPIGITSSPTFSVALAKL